MSRFHTVMLPHLESVDVTTQAPNEVTMRGTIAIADPGPALGGFLRALHEAALADELREVVADVRQLTFVNSSAIRLFVDWATWLSRHQGPRYMLRFRTDRRVTWQRTSFTVLQSMTGKAVIVDAE
jgi:hypothetical protein